MRLLYWLLLGLFGGVSSERIEDRARRLPNQGVRRSLSNSVLLALISSVFISVIGVLNYELGIELSVWLSLGLNSVMNLQWSDVLSYWLNIGPMLAVCGGLLVCSARGGLAVLRHYVIRLLLARSRTFPWHAPRFLEEATTRILLRRVGGGYSFPHRLLLDYFADLPQEMP